MVKFAMTSFHSSLPFEVHSFIFATAGGIAGSQMAGNITLTGRQKDTIVLSNGENIEPQPIEDACCASNYISHMIVVGNNRRRLGALVAPATEAFQELEQVKGSFIVGIFTCYILC